MIYIGNFLQLTNLQATTETERRHGEFSLVIEAPNYDAAVEKFKARVAAYRTESDLFEGSCRIFFIQLLEFAKFPEDEAMMMSYKSFAGDPLLPFIGCSVPDGQDNSCKIYNWEESKLEIDGYSGKLFLEFEE